MFVRETIAKVVHLDVGLLPVYLVQVTAENPWSPAVLCVVETIGDFKRYSFCLWRSLEHVREENSCVSAVAPGTRSPFP